MPVLRLRGLGERGSGVTYPIDGYIQRGMEIGIEDKIVQKTDSDHQNTTIFSDIQNTIFAGTGP